GRSAFDVDPINLQILPAVLRQCGTCGGHRQNTSQSQRRAGNSFESSFHRYLPFIQPGSYISAVERAMRTATMEMVNKLADISGSEADASLPAPIGRPLRTTPWHREPNAGAKPKAR